MAALATAGPSEAVGEDTVGRGSGFHFPGAEGLLAVDEENIVIADEPDDFAEAVLRLMSDQVFRQRLEVAGRQTVLSSYDGDFVCRTTSQAYEALTPPAGEQGG